MSDTKLKLYLRSNNIMNKDIAEELGLDERSFNNYVCDTNPISLKVAHKLCKILNCKPEEILDDDLTNRYYKEQYPYNVIYEIVDNSDYTNIELLAKNFDENVDYFFKTVGYDDPKDLDILRLRYKELYTLQEIGDVYGVTRERIRQIIDTTVARLKHKGILKYLINGKEVIELEKEAHDIKIKLYNDYVNYLKSDELRKQIDELIQNSACNESVITKINENSTIEFLDLSCRSYTCLKNAGIKYVHQLANMSINKLTNIKNMGKKSVNEIANKMEELGFTLKYDILDAENDEEVVLSE